MPCGANLGTICGGPSALSLYAFQQPAPPYAYIGCYGDTDNQPSMGRALPVQLSIAEVASVAQCASLAYAGGYLVFGLEFSGGEPKS